jgi:hypothetical protein
MADTLAPPRPCDARIRVSKWFRLHRPGKVATVTCGKPGRRQVYRDGDGAFDVVRCSDHALFIPDEVARD